MCFSMLVMGVGARMKGVRILLVELGGLRQIRGGLRQIRGGLRQIRGGSCKITLQL